MNTKFVGILGGLAAVLVGLALVLRGGGSGTSAESEKLFPGLTAKVNDVASLTVRQGKHETVLEKRNGQWRVAGKSGYPAQFERVKAAIVGLADLAIVETKTSDPELYSRLEVQDPTVEDAAKEFGGPMLVTIKDSAGATLAGVIIGKTVGGEEAYARRIGEAASFQVKGKVLSGELAADPLRWVERAFVKLDKAKVLSVLLASPETADKGIVLAKPTPEATEPTLIAVPEGRQVNTSAVQQTLGSLSYISFEDVAPVASINFDEGKIAEFTTTDGMTITARLVQKDGKWWSAWAASGNEEATKLNEGLAPWAFQIQEFKAKQLAVELEGLLQAVTPPATPGLPGSPGPSREPPVLGPVGQ